MMKLPHIFICILFQINISVSQPFFPSSYKYQAKRLFLDGGRYWQSLTTFGPLRNELEDIDSKGLIGRQISFSLADESFELFGAIKARYNSFYYGFFYPSIGMKKKDQPPNGRFEINNIKFGQSGIGYQNSWITLQFGKAKESWGSGEKIELALSHNSETYDYFLLGTDFGSIRLRYIHGFLGKVFSDINRYITARGIEWTNKESLIIALSETVIYSGQNRLLDIGYVNPVSTHLEVELNNRLNTIGGKDANGVWQLHIDYLFKKKIRFSLNYLYDEFVIDRDIEVNKEHGKAFSMRLAYAPVSTNSHIFTLFSSMVKVGTPTFRHGNGLNNFVHDGNPLGWSKGSDCQDYSLGMNYANNKNLIFSMSTGVIESGNESIINRSFDSYLDYFAGPFPSGTIKRAIYFESYFNFRWKENFSISNNYIWFSDDKLFKSEVKFVLLQNF